MIRRAAGGLLLAAWLAACSSIPPSTPAVSTGPTPAPRVALNATENPGEPLPPADFDPASLPAFYYFTEDGRVGVWSGPIGRPDLATPLVDPISESDGDYRGAVRFPDGSVVVPFASTRDDAYQVVLVRTGAEPEVLLDRAAGSLGAAQELASFVVARTMGLDDDGVWQVWLDGREPVQVLPPVGPPELAGRDLLALSADGKGVAAAACAGEMQIRWPGEDATRVVLGSPVGFDRAGNLIAYGDCSQSRVVRVALGGAQTNELGPPATQYQAILTPDRRHMAMVEPEALADKIVIIDLETGEQRTAALAGSGWDFTSDSTDRFVVMRRDDGAGEVYRWTWAVHDLLEGWTGYFVVDTYPPAP